jgi:hypothetical protein
MNAHFEEKIHLLLKANIEHLFYHCRKRGVRRGVGSRSQKNATINYRKTPYESSFWLVHERSYKRFNCVLIINCINIAGKSVILTRAENFNSTYLLQKNRS